MQFFNLFYLKAFRIGGDELFEKIRFSINQLNDFEKLESLMANNQFFTNNKLREIAIIKGLFDSYNPVSIAKQQLNQGDKSELNYSVNAGYRFNDKLSVNLNAASQVSKYSNKLYNPTCQLVMCKSANLKNFCNAGLFDCLPSEY